MVHEEGDMLVHCKKRMRKEKRKEKRAASWDKKRKRESKTTPKKEKAMTLSLIFFDTDLVLHRVGADGL